MPVTNTACGICDGLFVSITSKIEGGVFRETYWSLDKICKIKYVILYAKVGICQVSPGHSSNLQ